MRILITILIIMSLCLAVNAKHYRRSKHHHQQPIKIVVVKNYGNGRFNLQNKLSEIMEFLNSENLRARIGQSAVHNRMGWAHLNALDVSVRPGSEKGKKLMKFLQFHWIPFISISGAKKGVSTGPHVHLGFTSPHT